MQMIQLGKQTALVLFACMFIACGSDEVVPPLQTTNPAATPTPAADSDKDGIPNTGDNCASAANPSQLDTDGDGDGDACDSDADNDGKTNNTDNCPTVPNAEQTNTDLNIAGGDGFGDACDTDDDADGVSDKFDNCRIIFNVDQTDSDKDQLGDVCDPDRDGDGVANEEDNCPDVYNPQQDKEACIDIEFERKVDSDLDGVADRVPDRPGVSGDNCNVRRNAAQTDTDGDGVGDICDNCPSVKNVVLLDEKDSLGRFYAQPDDDGNGIGNACEFDDPDEDGVPTFFIDFRGPDSIGPNGIADIEEGLERTRRDNCPNTFNPDQRNSDQKGPGDACGLCDFDGDGVPDPAGIDPFGDGGLGFEHCGCQEFDEEGNEDCDVDYDNCPLTPNPAQEDGDNDGVGDVCDNCLVTGNADQSDGDGDGVGDACDNCKFEPNADQLNADSDLFGDACDNCVDDANADQFDADENGVGDVCDADRDNDGVVDPLDNCPDTPNGPGNASNQVDTDGDEIGDVCDNCPAVNNPAQPNADGDIFGDACDVCPLSNDTSLTDSDGDGVPDACDACVNVPDQDNSADQDMDDVPDACDGDCLDDDGDGFPNAQDLCPQTPSSTNTGDECKNPDADEDGVSDWEDNCPQVTNPNQFDSDSDRVGDACENEDLPNDVDDDGVENDIDNCLFTQNPLQQDSDNDGWGDACDNCETVKNPDQFDQDRDGEGDACDACEFVNQAENGGCDLVAGTVCGVDVEPPAVEKDLALVLLMDRSGSMGAEDTAGFEGGTRMEALQAEVGRRFIGDETTPGLDPETDLSGAVAYSDSVDLPQDITALHDETLLYVEELVATGGTNAAPGLRVAGFLFEDAELSCDADLPVRCVVIHITDGRSNNPNDDPELAATNLKANGIEVFAIGVGPESVFGPENVDGQNLMNQVSEPVDEHYCNATDAESLATCFDIIFDDLLGVEPDDEETTKAHQNAIRKLLKPPHSSSVFAGD